MAFRPVKFDDEERAILRVIRFSAPELRVGEPIDVKVSEEPEKWRRTRIAAIRRDGVRVAGLRAPAPTGVICPWCEEPVGITHTSGTARRAYYCPACEHRGTGDAPDLQ